MWTEKINIGRVASGKRSDGTSAVIGANAHHRTLGGLQQNLSFFLVCLLTVMGKRFAYGELLRGICHSRRKITSHEMFGGKVIYSQVQLESRHSSLVPWTGIYTLAEAKNASRVSIASLPTLIC